MQASISSKDSRATQAITWSLQALCISSGISSESLNAHDELRCMFKAPACAACKND